MKKLVYFIGNAVMFGVYLALFMTFMTIYLSPHDVGQIVINDYNEANLEAVLLIVTLPCVVYAWLKNMKGAGTGRK